MLYRRWWSGGAKLVVGLVIGVLTVQALMLFAFAWPASETGPREVPVVLAGPPEAVGQIDQALSAVPSPDDDVAAFDVTRVEDAVAAEEAITDRDAYGGVVVTPDGPEMLVATGAGPAVARILQGAATELASAGAPVPVRDVAPPTEDDPTGGGLASGMLPLVLTSGAGGLFIALRVPRMSARLNSVFGLAVAGGLGSAALLQYVVGVTDGSYWALSGMIGLTVGAISATVAGLGAVFGTPGAAVGMLLMIFLGNPLSAAPSAPELLPQPWGDLGQLMPPGATVTALRSVAFFDGAALTTPVVVLSTWLLAGLLLVLFGRSRPLRATRDAPASATPAPVTVR